MQCRWFDVLFRASEASPARRERPVRPGGAPRGPRGRRQDRRAHTEGASPALPFPRDRVRRARKAALPRDTARTRAPQGRFHRSEPCLQQKIQYPFRPSARGHAPKLFAIPVTTSSLSKTRMNQSRIRLLVLATSSVAAACSAGPTASSDTSDTEQLAANSSDLAEYGFESSAEAWTVSGSTVTGVASTGARAFAGSRSLAVSLKGSLGTGAAYVASPSTPAGSTVTFHVVSGGLARHVHSAVCPRGGGGELEVDRRPASDVIAESGRLEHARDHTAEDLHAALPARRRVHDERRRSHHLLRRQRGMARRHASARRRRHRAAAGRCGRPTRGRRWVATGRRGRSAAAPGRRRRHLEGRGAREGPAWQTRLHGRHGQRPAGRDRPGRSARRSISTTSISSASPKWAGRLGPTGTRTAATSTTRHQRRPSRTATNSTMFTLYQMAADGDGNLSGLTNDAVHGWPPTSPASA